MPVSIGAVTLSDHLYMSEPKNLPVRAGSVRTTVTGGIIDQSIPIGPGNSIELYDPGEYGLFLGAQVDAINVYKASRETVVFVHHQGSWNVVVDAVEVEQADGIVDPDGDSEYTGTITMIIVE